MSAMPKPRKLTAIEYLAIEEKAEFKSEFFDGEMFVMSGATVWHNIIKDNIVGELHGKLKGGPCFTMSSDMRLNVTPTGLYTYPDLVIVCGRVEFDPLNANTITNPTVVVEVLSPSTETYDRGAKFRKYQKLASVKEIVFVSQDLPVVEVYARQSDGRWVLSTYDDPAGSFALSSVAVTVLLADVYRNVEFPPESPSQG